MRRTRSNYTEEEVAALIVHYAELAEARDTTRRGLRTLVRLADLTRALGLLPRQSREVVLLHGLIGLSQEETAHYLQISQQAVSKRYRRGVEDVLYILHEGDE